MKMESAFYCSISLEIMRDPVILGSTGRTFERKAIEEWLKIHETDPISNEFLKPEDRAIIPNRALKDAIDEYLLETNGLPLSPNKRKSIPILKKPKQRKHPKKKKLESLDKKEYDENSSLQVSFNSRHINITTHQFQIFIIGISTIFIIMFAVFLYWICLIRNVYTMSMQNNYNSLYYNSMKKMFEHNNPHHHLLHQSRSSHANDGVTGNTKMLLIETKKQVITGRYEYSDGTYYEGDLVDGRPQGVGKFYYHNGDNYAGEVFDDKAHGFGTYTFKNKDKYEGYMVNGERHGYGKMTWSDDSSSYEGIWEHDLRCGKGKMSWSDGTYYEGGWKKDVRSGSGFYKYSNGDFFEGEIENDLREGQGKIVLSDGSYYVGQWKDDSRHGHGVMTWPDGTVYDGQWANDKQHGKCTINFPEGTIFKGKYKNGQMHGRGKMIFKDGRVEQGDFSTSF